MGITDYLSRNPQRPAPPDQLNEDQTVVIGVTSDLNSRKDKNLCPEIEKEIRANFLKRVKFDWCKQKNALWRKICYTQLEEEAMLPCDAIKLAYSISEKANQPITSKREQTERLKTSNQLIPFQLTVKLSQIKLIALIQIQKVKTHVRPAIHQTNQFLRLFTTEPTLDLFLMAIRILLLKPAALIYFNRSK